MVSADGEPISVYSNGKNSFPGISLPMGFSGADTGFMKEGGTITESVDSVYRDTTYTQYMLIQKNLSKSQKRYTYKPL